MYKETIINISENFTKEQLVSILILCTSELDIKTISEMARSENKTPRGIRISNQYRKIKIGKQTFAIKGLSNNQFPF